MNIYNTKEVIKEAGNNKRTLKMIYLKSSESLEPREIEPYEIRDNDFFGYDVKKEGIRRFKLEEISSIEKTDNKFTPRWEIKV